MRQISKRRFILDNFKDRYDRNNLVKVPREKTMKFILATPFDKSIEICKSYFVHNPFDKNLKKGIVKNLVKDFEK